MKVQNKLMTRPAKAVKPALSLKADRLVVDAEQMIAVTVDFKGVDSVELALEPKKGFTIDLKSLNRPGIVRLRAKRDGTSTVIATAKKGSAVIIRKEIHLKCVGPVVRILAFGYIPGK